MKRYLPNTLDRFTRFYHATHSAHDYIFFSQRYLVRTKLRQPRRSRERNGSFRLPFRLWPCSSRYSYNRFRRQRTIGRTAFYPGLYDQTEDRMSIYV
jgi:hypothetical protein